MTSPPHDIADWADWTYFPPDLDFYARAVDDSLTASVWEFRDDDGTQARDENGKWSGGGGSSSGDSGEFDGETLHRGMNVKLTKEQYAELDSYLRSPMKPAEFNQRFKAGTMILEILTGFKGRASEGLGKHWTSREGMAETAALAGNIGGMPIQISARTRKKDIETDIKRLIGNQFHGEDETTLVPDAKVDIVDIRIKRSGQWESVWDVGNEGQGEIAFDKRYGDGAAKKMNDEDAKYGLAAETVTAAAALQMTAEMFGKIPPGKRGPAPTHWYVSPDEFKAAQKLVADKVRKAPKPTGKEIAKNRDALDKSKVDGSRPGGELRGNNEARKARAEALFVEFGGGEHGYVPCGHCGIKVAPGARDGHALMTQDKIRTAAEGGDYGTPTDFPNLIPSCTGCNASRNDTPLVAAGYTQFRDTDGTQPRDDQGQWSTTGGIGGIHADGVTEEAMTAVVATTVRNRVNNDIATREGVGYDAYNAQLDGKANGLQEDLLAVWEGDRTAMERRAKLMVDANKYEPSESPEQVAKIREAVKLLADNKVMAAAVAKFGTVEIVAVKDPGAAAEYVRNYIVVGDNAGRPLTNHDDLGIAGPLRHGAFTYDNSLVGALRHEYGHHVQSMMSYADDKVWRQAHIDWGGHTGQGGMRTIANQPQVTDDKGYWQLSDDDVVGASLYARSNAHEAFAETFSLVSHPDFDLAKVPKSGRVLVDAMLKILKGKT